MKKMEQGKLTIHHKLRRLAVAFGSAAAVAAALPGCVGMDPAKGPCYLPPITLKHKYNVLSVRSLTAGELHLAQSLFGGHIDFSDVLVFDTPPDDEHFGAHASTDGIYMHGGSISEDYSLEKRGHNYKRRLFVHEMTHVVQYRTGICIDQMKMYDYTLDHRSSFTKLPIEAQARLMEDYLSLVEDMYKTDRALYTWSMDDFTDGIPYVLYGQIKTAVTEGKPPPRLTTRALPDPAGRPDDVDTLRIRVVEAHFPSARRWRERVQEEYARKLPVLQEAIDREYARIKALPPEPAPARPEPESGYQESVFTIPFSPRSRLVYTWSF